MVLGIITRIIQEQFKERNIFGKEDRGFLLERGVSRRGSVVRASTPWLAGAAVYLKAAGGWEGGREGKVGRK